MCSCYGFCHGSFFVLEMGDSWKDVLLWKLVLFLEGGFSKEESVPFLENSKHSKWAPTYIYFGTSLRVPPK